MSLVYNWKAILRRARSVHLLYFLIFISAVEAGLPFVIDGFALPAGVSAGISAVVAALAIWARVTYQPEVHQ